MDTQRFALAHLAAHLHEAEAWDRLFELVDERGFLSYQVHAFASFDRSTADLEQHVLQGTLAQADWERFARYALLAVNLRGLAEALANEEILLALARRGQGQLALGLARQLGDRLRSLWAQSVLVRFLPEEGLVREIHDQLESLTGPLDPQLLQGIARHLGPELDQLWRERLAGWVPAPRERDEIWWTLAEAWASRHGFHAPGFRNALAAIGDAGLRIERLPGFWLRHGPDDPGDARRLAAEIGDPDGRLFWHVALALLGRLAAAADDPAWAERAWREQAAQGPRVSWSAALIEQGGALFGRFSPAGADHLIAEMEGPQERAALRVVRLEQQPGRARAGEALAAVEALTDPDAKLHWSLRMALAWPPDDPKERQRLTSVLLDHLYRRRYSAPAGDLARFLDLVGSTLTDELAMQTDNVVWSPAMKPETLLLLAAGTTRPAVLLRLIEKGESYAAVVGPTEAEGFELRTRLLIGAAARLCRLQRTWDPLDEVVVRKLLPDEEDELREAAARELADLGKTADAVAVAQKIRSPRLRLIVQLSIAPDDAAFDPENLYEAVASTEAAEDERLALEMLTEPPLDPESLIERYLTRIRSRERQVQALIDLARRAQALEELHREGQKDPMAPLQLVRSSLTAVGSDEHLLRLTLELVELAAPLQRARALAEVHEAAEVILLRLNVPWGARREAFETLLARLGPILLGKPVRDRELMARCGAVAGLLDLLADLPGKAEEGSAREELRAHWHEVFPVILAAAARLNGVVAAYLAHPVRARIWGQWLPEISQLVGWKRSWRLLERLEERLPHSWRERLRTRWNGIEYERFAASWDWLNEEQKEILRLCFEPPRELPDRITALAGARGLVFRLAVAAPERLPEVLGRFAEPERSRLALCLVRDGWIPPGEGSIPVSTLLAGIADPALRLDAEARQEGAGWLGALAERVARHGLDPADPAAWPLLRRLRDEPPPEAAAVLADAVLGALAHGRERGEDAFRVWLNGFLASRAGREEALAQAGRIREALQKALRLGPARREAETPGDGEAPARDDDGEQDRAFRIVHRWGLAQLNSRQNRSWSLLKERESLGHGGVFVVVVSTLCAAYVDLELWQPSEPARSAVFPWWPVALALLFLGNLRFCGQILRSSTPWALSKAWRIGTTLAFGIPVLGFVALFATARWAPTGENPGETLTLESRRSFHRLRSPFAGWTTRLFREWGAAFYLISNAAFLVGFLASAPPEKAIGLSVLLHAMAAAGLAVHLWSEAPKTTAVRLVPALLLASTILSTIPFVSLIGFALYTRVMPKKDERLLMRALEETRKSSLRLPRGSHLRETWRRARSSGLKNRLFSSFDWGGPWRQISDVRERQPSERSLLWLHLFKSVALLFDGAALFWLLLKPFEGFLETVLASIAFVLLTVSSVLGGVGLLLMLLRLGMRRWSFLDRHPGHHYLVAHSLVLWTGAFSGYALHEGDGEMLGVGLGIFSLAAFVAWLSRLVPLAFLSGGPSKIEMGGIVLLIALFALAFLTGEKPGWAGAVLWLFGACTAVFPFAIPLFLLRRHIGALLRPFGPGDILDPAWPRPLRRTLLFLTITALLPLGGLAVPAWIWIRARRWPQFEREWEKRVARRQGTGSQILAAPLQIGP